MDEPVGSSKRARRAIPLIAAALGVVVVASLVYLHPRFGSAIGTRPAAVSPSPPLLAPQYSAVYDFATPSSGWALVVSPGDAPSRYWIFHTSDAARHWTMQLSDSGTVEGVEQLVFFDGTHGFFSLGGDAVQRTTDGGRHWERIALPPYAYSAVDFSDPLHAWYLGYAPPTNIGQVVYHLEATTDGGASWTERSLPRGAGFPLVFRNQSEGWTAGYGGSQAFLYVTADGAISWQAHALPVPDVPAGGKPGIAADLRLLPRNGVLATIGVTLYTSFDRGATWTEIAQPPAGNSYSDFAFQDSTHWWTMRTGDLFKSADAGASWVHVHLQVDGWEYAVGVIDAQHAWSRLEQPSPGTTQLGSGLALTFDGGFHWTYANVPEPD